MRSSYLLIKRISAVLLCSFWILPLMSQVQINEFQASNISTRLDQSGNYREWIEIHNSGTSGVNLDGYYLSSNLANPYLYQIRNIWIAADNYTLIWIDKTNDDPCCVFELDMEGGELGLFSPSGQLLDSVRYQTQYLDVSQGRSPDVPKQWDYFAEPTPLAPNSSAGIVNPVLAEEVIFSLEGGLYSGNQQLELSTASNEGEIRYTTDGSWPTSTSLLYAESLLLNTTSVIRAGLFQEGKLPGQIATKTYILNESSTIPVVSIATDDKYFFDNNMGIYVEGTNGIIGRCAEDPVNWNRDWERPANIEYYTKEGLPAINQVTGVRVHGGCSRMWLYKSLAVIARNKYGDNSLSHQFFESKEIDEFKSIILRNSGNDAYFSMMRDGFMQSILTGQMDLDCQGYQPANVFINGEYWGILNVREKLNEHYPDSNYDMDSDQIDMLEREQYLLYKQVIHGSGEHYEDLIDYVNNNSLSVEANYEYVKTQMDVNEYINFFVANIYFENEDWPHNNVKYWRPHIEGGKWRWILYDTDWGFGLIPRTGNTLEACTNDRTCTILIRSLLANENFRNEFIQRMAGFINTTFNPVRVDHIYDSIKTQLGNEIQKHIDRWNKPPLSTYIDHTENVLPGFTQERPPIVRTQYMNKFGISGMYNLSASVNDPGNGYIRACEVVLPDNFSGSFFSDVPLRLVAIPKSGYAFSHWEGASASNSESIFLTASADASINAVFVPDTPISNVHINEVCASNQSSAEDEFGQMDDWIEIYNDNDFDVNLAGCYLSDSAGLSTKYRIPNGLAELTTVPANGYLIIWCDGEAGQGPMHSNFKLQKEGEVLSLVQQIEGDFHYVDSIQYPSLQTDLTYGRIPLSSEWEQMNPTPLAINEVLDFEYRELFINEFMTRNCGVVSDEFSENDDWIEIYNPGPDTIDLGGLFFTDSLQDPMKHYIPAGHSATKIPPYGYKILWADNQPEQGPLHLDFRLGGKSEQIGVYLLGYGFIDSLSYDLAGSGMAMGRYADGSDFIQAVSASPGAPNVVRTVENLHINEFMARNSSTLADPMGEYDDWIEIYNDNEFPVDIGGLFITDSLASPSKCWIPSCEPELTTIAAKGFIVLWADGQEEQGSLHLNFKLSGIGEEIGLVQADGIEYIDTLSYWNALSDMAIGRMEDGFNHIQIVSASPGSSNHVIKSEKLYISEVSASGNNSHADPSGEYDDWIEIYNDNDFEVNLGGLYITDSMDHPCKFRIPTSYPDSTTIGAKDYLILWADNQTEQGIRHLGFKLKGDGEQVALVDIDCLGIIDSVSYPNQYSNFTYSRTNNTDDWLFLRPTHGAFNVNTPLSGIFINEFMASNSSIPDEFGENDDWIELYNANDVPVDVGGLFLTDSLGDPTQFRIPSHSPEITTILPKGFFVLFADNTRDQGLNHTNFKLSSDGEAILLFQYDEVSILDSLTYPKQYKNSASGRIAEAGDWYTIPPTPGFSNLIPDFSQLVINEVMGNNKTQYMDEYEEYDDWIELYNSGNTPLDIGGLYLSDSMGDPGLFRVSSEHSDSTTIAARDYLLLWADSNEEQGILHLGFKISKTGETVGIFDYTLSLIDSTAYPFISPNQSWGRTTDGDITWISFTAPTPLMSNSLTSAEEDVLNSTVLSVYPNPVTDQAVFEVTLNEASELVFDIIDSKGITCSTMKGFHDGNGTQRFPWKVRDASGKTLESGFYVCRIQTKEGLLIRKLVVRAQGN